MSDITGGTVFEGIIGHENVTHYLFECVKRDRIANAYLFYGSKSVGKIKTALAFVAAALCKNRGCGECNICRRVLQLKHPDLVVVEASGKNIPVEVIREIRLMAYRKPIEGKYRFFIIRDAELMWEEAASTLLKVLEEPPDTAVFILVSVSPSSIMPTLMSRCEKIRFAPVAREKISSMLTAMGLDPDRADLIARISGGLPGRAIRLFQEPWHLERRENVLKVARALKHADLATIIDMAEELYGEIIAPVEEMAVLYRKKKQELSDMMDESALKRFSKLIDEEYSRERIKEETASVKDTLQILSSWYRDILIMKECDDEEMLVNVDYIQEIETESRVLDQGTLVKVIDTIDGALKAVDQNVPTQLVLESALTGIQGVLRA